MLNRKRDSFIPLRQMKWKKYSYLRNIQNHIYYDCECGKRYVSFPAIYLHFQRKHNIKISANISQEHCEVRKKSGQVVYYYSIDTKQNSPETQIQKQIHFVENKSTSILAITFRNFLAEEQIQISQIISNCLIQKIFIQLQNFVISAQKGNVQPYLSSKQLLHTLPFYFNSFAIKWRQAGLSKQIQFENLCQSLFVLSKWLIKKGISNLIVEYNAQQAGQ